MNSPITLSQLLTADENRSLQRLVGRCRRLQALEQRVLACLEISLFRQCRLVNLQDDTLVLGVYSAALAARLRYQLPALQQCLAQQAGLAGVKRVVIKVIAEFSTVANQGATVSGGMQLSASSAQTLRSCAKTIDHEGLRLALNKLAGRQT